MRITVGYGDPARGQVRKLLRASFSNLKRGRQLEKKMAKISSPHDHETTNRYDGTDDANSLVRELAFKVRYQRLFAPTTSLTYE